MVEDLTADDDLADAIDAGDADYDADIARGYRMPKNAVQRGKETATGTSWWLGKSREELSTLAAERTALSAKTKVGRSVKGTVNTP